MLLNHSATDASQVRLQHARDIAAACPPTLYDEIALTGSSARGIATGGSDIEINFWVDRLPVPEARLGWIKKLGTKNVLLHQQPRPDDSHWITADYKGIELEAGWQTFAALETALTALIDARVTDHKALRLAELVLSAKSLRGIGALDKWQSILKDYPGDLAPLLINDALTDWLSPDWLSQRQAQHSFKDDIHRVWRLIFAINHQWEINWKYAVYSLPSLEKVPANVIDRIAAIQQSDVEQSASTMLTLIKDTLELIKANYGNTQSVSENIKLIQLLLTQMQ